MYLIVGLGNPGAEYTFHRHNMGFLALDHIQDMYEFREFSHTKWNADVTKGFIDTHKAILAKPTTYMNLSGQAIQSIMAYYKIKPEHIIVIHDDLDLTPGEVRIKLGGGHGGHNGLRDIDQRIGNNYWRIRIGIGHPGHKDKVASYVLGNIPVGEADAFQKAFTAISKNFTELFDKDKIQDKKFINRVKAALQ